MTIENDMIDQDPTLCPGCGKPYKSPDFDPRCSSCAESGTEPIPERIRVPVPAVGAGDKTTLTKAEVMSANADELRRAAEACDRGFGLEMWHATEYGVSPVDETEPMIAEVIVDEHAAFIAAANPVAVLALLDELAALKARNADRRCWHCMNAQNSPGVFRS